MKLRPVIVRLIRTADGASVNYKDDLYTEEDYSGIYIWSDGNYSCDCNRYSFFQRALGLSEMEEDSECSFGKYRVEWIKDAETGEVLYEES